MMQSRHFVALKELYSSCFSQFGRPLSSRRWKNLIRVVKITAIKFCVQSIATYAGTMASKKRGMSLEDKRATLLDIFHESKDVFLLKDIERLGSKRGVVLQSVKDVLQSLVDDDLVHQEKIGVRKCSILCNIRAENSSVSLLSYLSAGVELLLEFPFGGSGEARHRADKAQVPADNSPVGGGSAATGPCKEPDWERKLGERLFLPAYMPLQQECALLNRSPLSPLQAERDTLARQVAMLEEEVTAKRHDLQQYAANDPERYEALSTWIDISRGHMATIHTNAWA